MEYSVSDSASAVYSNALNRMYRLAIEKVLSLPEGQQQEFKKWLEAITTSSANIGWGYQDSLRQDYYDAFAADE